MLHHFEGYENGEQLVQYLFRFDDVNKARKQHWHAPKMTELLCNQMEGEGASSSMEQSGYRLYGDIRIRM